MQSSNLVVFAAKILARPWPLTIISTGHLIDSGNLIDTCRNVVSNVNLVSDFPEIENITTKLKSLKPCRTINLTSYRFAYQLSIIARSYSQLEEPYVYSLSIRSLLHWIINLSPSRYSS